LFKTHPRALAGKTEQQECDLTASLRQVIDRKRPACASGSMRGQQHAPRPGGCPAGAGRDKGPARYVDSAHGVRLVLPLGQV
jgi:hypothetical protein